MQEVRGHRDGQGEDTKANEDGSQNDVSRLADLPFDTRGGWLAREAADENGGPLVAALVVSPPDTLLM